jgi:hypothetical protein
MMWGLSFAGLLVGAAIVVAVRRHSRYLDELDRSQIWRIDPEGQGQSSSRADEVIE